MLAYNVGQIFDRGRLTDALAGRYRSYILACAEKASVFLDDVDGFAALPDKTQEELLNIELFRATGYERPYYDEQLILRQIGSYQRYIRRLLDPAIRKAAPNIKWDKQLYSAYTYLMDVQEFLDWHETPDFILRMLDDAGDQALALMKRMEPPTSVTPAPCFPARKPSDFIAGRPALKRWFRNMSIGKRNPTRTHTTS